MKRHINTVTLASVVATLSLFLIACGVGTPTRQITEEVSTQETPVAKAVSEEAPAVHFDLDAFNRSLDDMMDVAGPGEDMWGAAEQLKEGSLADYAGTSGASSDEIHSLRNQLDQIIAEAIESFQVGS